jgi:hypothetical protein
MPTVQRFNTGRSSQFLDSSPTAVFTVPGNLTTTDNDKILWVPGRNTYVSQATAQVKVAPVGANITVDIQLITRSTGAVVSTLGTVTIPDGNLEGTVSLSLTQILDTQALAAVITNVGSGTAGADLTVQVFF